MISMSRVFSSNSSLQLVNIDSTSKLFGVNNDLHVQSVLLQHPLDGGQVDPEVVGVENIELLHRLEVLFMFLGNLSSLQKSEMAFILNQSSSLDISPGLVSDLHDKLSIIADDHVENVEVNSGTEVVNVGDEAELLPILQELIQKPTVEERLVEVPMTRRIPGFLIISSSGRFCHWHH